VARFDAPRGLAFGRDAEGRAVLWVADTGHHALRAVDPDTGHVRTVAGTGVRAFTAAERAAGALASPWALAVLARGGRERVVVAMAGTHQLALFDPADGRVRPMAGGRGEDVRDGPPLEALFAQPMAVAADGDRVWSADAEASAVRELALAGAGAVRTLVGTGLFDFGDADGEGDTVRLQHAQGVARADDGRLVVADTYNDALKWCDPATRRVTTLARGLREPTAVAVAGAHALVADTGAHRVAVVGLDDGVVRPLAVELPDGAG
jgi:hypothetical protein